MSPLQTNASVYGPGAHSVECKAMLRQIYPWGFVKTPTLTSQN